MRQTIAGLVAMLAVAAAAPAQACQAGGCGSDVAVYHGPIVIYGFGHREHLPDPTASGSLSYYGPQYYYVNHGPTYTGPGNLAPAPTYQERAVSGWQSYNHPYYYGYNGGPYGNATSHYYDGANLQGPVVYRYRAGRTAVSYPPAVRPRRVAPKYYYTSRENIRYGHSVRRGYARVPARPVN